MSLADLRREYTLQSLDVRDVDADPIRQFERWFDEARRAGLIEPNAMALATATLDGRPSVRMVLLKEVDARGFVFFTDYRSAKGAELDANPRAALCFWWDALQRQVRVTGTTARVSRAESEAYFRTRPRGARIGAWASQQSRVLEKREDLEREVARLEREHPGDDVPSPPHWGGYRLAPDRLECWQGRPNRQHDRIAYVREEKGWRIERLSP